MYLLVAGTSGGALTTVAGDAVADPLKPGQLFDVDMDHVPGALPLVATNKTFGVKVLQASQAQALHEPTNGGEGRTESPGDAAERAALVPQVYSLLELLRIERPPLAAANTPSIRQCRYAACSKPGEPLVGRTQADPGLCCKGFEWHAFIEMPADEPFPTDGCQSGQRVAMHGV